MAHFSGKGKELDDTPPPPPLLDLLNEMDTTVDSENWDDWIGFKEAGFMDLPSMEEKDYHALLRENESLGQKLCDYEHNMGLILAENKDLKAKVNELGEAISERDEVISCNEAEHLTALSEAEKREENMRKMLDLEKACRVDLENSVHEISEENEKLKLSSQTALADANNLVAEVEDLSTEVHKKMQEADAKLNAANAKSMELDRRFEEIETRESMVMNECFLFEEGRKRWEVKLSKQNEDMQAWERKLHEGEERLCEDRRIVNQREKKVDEMEMALERKEKELEDVEADIDLSSSEVKRKEDDLNNRLANLIAEEMEVESIKRNLETKETELLDLAEKLDEKERVEIQKLLDAHKDALNSKQHEFDLQVEEKRKSIEEEMRTKVEIVEKKESEVNHREEIQRKQEQVFEKKTERFKHKENELDTKLKALNEKEKSINADIKKIEMDQKQILADKESLQMLKDNIEKVMAEITERELKLREDEEKLKITEDERTTLAHLQSELKEEINRCRIQTELLEKQAEDLRKVRMKFEEEWTALDDRKTEITKKQKELDEQKETLEKLHKSEEVRLEKAKNYTKDFKRKLEVLEKERESFVASMQHGQSLLFENAENKLKQLLHDCELKTQALEVNQKAKRLQIEKQFQEKEKAFEDEREKEYRNINYLKEVNKNEREELEHERRGIDKEKEEISINKKQLEENQLEMHKDVNNLFVLSEKIQNQREEFANERSHFLSIVEKLKTCGKCGELTKNFELSDLQMLEGSGDSPLSKTVDANIEKTESISIASENNKSPNSVSLMSWFKKSVTNFKLSPHQNNIIENVPEQSSETLHESQQTKLISGSRAKRSHDQTCLEGGNDMVVADSEVGSESVTKGGRKKARLTTVGKFNEPGDADTVGTGDTLLVKNTESGENLNGTDELSGDNIDAESGSDEERDRDEVSFGKKLWTFLST